MIAKRLKKTFFAILAGRGIMAVRQIILIPILIRAWGADLHGQWLVLSAIPSFLAMSNLGLGTSAHIKLALDIAGGRSKDVCRILTASTTVILIIGALVCSLVFALTPIFFHRNNQNNLIEQPHFVLFFLVATLFIKMLAQPLSGIWTGIGNPSYAGHAGNLCSIVELLFSVAVPLLGGGPTSFTLLIFLVNFLWLVAFGAKTVGLIEDKSQLLCKPDLSIIKQLIVPGIGHQIGPLWQAILFQGSILLSNSLLGPAGTSTWGALRVVCRCGNQILELITQSLGPEFQIAAGKQDRLGLSRLFVTGLLTSLGLSFFIAVFTMVLAPSFFEIWADSSYTIPRLVWILMSLAIVPFSLWWLAGEFLRAINNAWTLNVIGTITASLSIALMWGCGKAGLFSLALGSIIFEITMVIIILPITLKQLNVGWKELFVIASSNAKTALLKL